MEKGKIKIPFNKPFLVGKELFYIAQSVLSGHTAGDGLFTKKCHEFFKKKYGFEKVLLTTSCTDALEMSALLCDIEPGDEVIMPSYTFVSMANAFILRGAKPVFADIDPGYPNIDIKSLEGLITDRTRAIVVVHYAGVACDMDSIMQIAHKHDLFVIEDAAHAIDSFYKGTPLGSIGHFSTFSFHDTKNIIAGEGGMLAINDDRFKKRAEIIWEKGTNRVEFARGQVTKYGWVDIGSSFLPSEITASFLYAQLESIDAIQEKRKRAWNLYSDMLKSIEDKGIIELPKIPSYATVNGNLFFILSRNPHERDQMIKHLKKKGILAVFHYVPLHSSEYFRNKHDGRELPVTERLSSQIIRLPLFTDISEEEIETVVKGVNSFFQ